MSYSIYFFGYKLIFIGGLVREETEIHHIGEKELALIKNEYFIPGDNHINIHNPMVYICQHKG